MSASGELKPYAPRRRARRERERALDREKRLDALDVLPRPVG
jgi:hypothetical protein